MRFFSEAEKDPIPVVFDDIRPRAYYKYKLSELSTDQLVLVNYNFENPRNKGFWLVYCMDVIYWICLLLFL